MAAQNGTIVLINLKTGESESVDFYAPDAVGTKLTFSKDGASASTSPEYVQFDDDVMIADISLATSPTAVGGIFTFTGTKQQSKTIRWANNLTSLQNRTKLKIKVPAGTQLGLTQFS